MSSPCLSQAGYEAWNADALSLRLAAVPIHLLGPLPARSKTAPEQPRLYPGGSHVVDDLSVVTEPWPARAGGLRVAAWPPASFWPKPCKRLQNPQRKTTPVSANTAAYNKARHGLLLRDVESCCDHIFEQLTAETDGSLQDSASALFLRWHLGSIPPSPRSPKLTAGIEPAWRIALALVMMLVAHDRKTGLAMRPQGGGRMASMR